MLHVRYWDTISAGAKELISKLLVVDAGKRFTAEQVMAHPWVAPRANASNFMLSGVIKQLRRYNTRRRQIIKRGFLVKRVRCDHRTTRTPHPPCCTALC